MVARREDHSGGVGTSKGGVACSECLPSAMVSVADVAGAVGATLLIGSCGNTKVGVVRLGGGKGRVEPIHQRVPQLAAGGGSKTTGCHRWWWGAAGLGRVMYDQQSDQQGEVPAKVPPRQGEWRGVCIGWRWGSERIKLLGQS